MVVPVLITSCHVSLNPKKGPETAHKISVPTAIANVTGCPAAREVHFANRVKKEVDFVTFMAIQNRNLSKISELVGALRVSKIRLTSCFLARPWPECGFVIASQFKWALFENSLRAWDQRHTISHYEA